MPYQGPSITPIHKGYFMAAGLTLMGTCLYNYKRQIAHAEETETEHDRIFKTIYTQIPAMLDKQGVQIDQEFRNKFVFIYRYFLEYKIRNKKAYHMRSQNLASKSFPGKCYIKINKVNGFLDLYVEYDKLSLIEKVNGVCYICGLAIPENHTVKRRIKVPLKISEYSLLRSKTRNHAVHEQCCTPEYIPDEKNDSSSGGSCASWWP